MSNRVYVTRTEFRNADGTSDYGVRVSDAYGKSFIDHWTEIPVDDIDLLGLVRDEEDDVIVAIFDFVLENGQGIHVDENYIEWDVLKATIFMYEV